MAKIKVRIVCRDGIVRTYKMNRNNFQKQVKANELRKVSFNKQLRRWVWKRTEVKEAKKKIEKKVEKIPEKKEKFFKVYAKIRYNAKEIPPYRHFYLDAYSYFKAKDEDEAKEMMKELIQSHFEEFPNIELHAEEVDEKEVEPEGAILYKHKKEEKWKQIRIDSYV